MKDLIQNNSSQDTTETSGLKRTKQALILSQFFLIIFVYHILKDLKDTLVITSSDAGAQVIPFLKIWVILPFAIFASYLFAKVYQKYGREKTLYFFVTLLLTAYLLFAFVLYPFREALYLGHVSEMLTMLLPAGCKGLIAIIGFWIYTLFYLAAELWSMMILTVLFWGYLNDITPTQEAKTFYPLCVFVGNCAGILSGQVSHHLCHTLTDVLSWGQTLQVLVAIVTLCGMGVMAINRWLARHEEVSVPQKTMKAPKKSVGFKESLLCIAKSRSLMCIAMLVVGFGLTNNLIEVVWKETIKGVYPGPQAYNAYVNQLTSMIGVGAVVMSLLSRQIFQIFSWSTIALITPVLLFMTSFVFFFSMQLPEEHLAFLASYFNMGSLYLIMTLGSIYYVLALVAKYTIFDMCKEMAFLSIDATERMRAKSVIDSVGSRLGKSGSSCLYQVLLIAFGSATGYVSIVGATAICVIGVSILATRQLGYQMEQKEEAKEELPSASF